MSWVKNLCDTYDACAAAVGIQDDKGNFLLPPGHSLTKIDVIVYLNSDGAFQRAEKVAKGKKAEKKNNFICLPCTEESAGRSSTGAIDKPHPLFDSIKYLCTANYRDNLRSWLEYLESRPEHALAYEAVFAVYQYIVKDTLLSDLKTYNITTSKTDELFTGFCVHMQGSPEERLWLMPEMWRAWNCYYQEERISKRTAKDVCYISGLENVAYMEKHPRSVVRAAGNARLISGNDKSNFTFRGRFKSPFQAVTVSYEASQKMHQALRWLVAGQSCYRCGSQAIIAWAIDAAPQVPSFNADSYGLYSQMARTDAQKLILAKAAANTDYALALRKALSGYGTAGQIKKHMRRVAVMAVDAATDGRMAVTYYRELAQDEYEERVALWHDSCKWYQLLPGSGAPQYFIGAPCIDHIALAVLGKPRSSNDEGYEKQLKNLRERVIHCIFDGERIPRTLVAPAVARASNPLALEDTGAKNGADRWRDWLYTLGAACALVKRYYHDNKKEEFAVRLEADRPDRDYLFGRLLAVADRIESHARYIQAKRPGQSKKEAQDEDDARATNALRYMTAFAQHPFRTWNLLFTQQLNPYIQQLHGAGWYLNLIGDIQQLFEAGAFERDAPLDGRFLLGFFAQRQELREHQKKQNDNGGNSNEPNEQN